MEELLERSPTLPQMYQTMAGNNEKSPEKLTLNSTRVRRTELVKKSTDKTRRRITTQRLVAASKANDWSSNPKAGLSNTQKLVPDVASKCCVPTYVNDVAQTQQLVANHSSGFLSANQKRRRTTYVIQTLALAQNNQKQATVELTIVDICSQLDNQTTHMRTNLSQLVPDATPQNGVVSNLSKRYRFALNKQDKAAAGYKHATRLH
ncbi:microtubule-associated protein 70-2-like [Dorcoceras hygrometricum]|uniref:Microtubule-associated protein 70-2-like n=1 Tax=Dorcoceras hygrometricum TaxID=472368 RepID=A0A2Z7C3C6_9LAMI|nr:microtubule-associated protein 70-2-like [Dorcoceras hygrometricum]